MESEVATTAASAVGPWRVRATSPSATEAFADVVSTHHRGLVRFAYLLCGDGTEAEDVVADAFAKVWPHWRRGRVDDLLPYVKRAIVNGAYGRGRHLQVVRRDEARHRAADADHGGEFEEGVGDRGTLWPLLARLPRQQRVIVVLRVVEDLSEERTAELVGVPPGTVKSRLSRGLAALRTMMEAHDA
jgi:RNA polymerase sigma-70 factor (sigma-E family)